MKKGKKNLLVFSNQLLSGVLAMLGFTSCNGGVFGGEVPCEYGQPYAKFEIKGKVQDEEKQPMEGMRVIVKENPPATSSYYVDKRDTLYTGETGAYAFSDGYAWPDMGYRIICEDPSGVYKADSIDVEMKPTEGDGNWYGGSDSKEVNFDLKKKEQQ